MKTAVATADGPERNPAPVVTSNTNTTTVTWPNAGICTARWLERGYTVTR